LIILGVNLNADNISRKKWDKLSDDQKFEVVQELYEITGQMEKQRDSYKDLLEEELRFVKKSKPRTGGFSLGIDAGFRYDKLSGFQPTMGVLVGGHIILYNRFMLNPGINVNFYKDPGAKIYFTIGWLF
jgi:hypothetical protein